MATVRALARRDSAPVVATEPERLIRIRIDGTRYGISADDIEALAAREIPKALTPADLTPAQAALRSAVKAIVPKVLQMIGGVVGKVEGQLRERTGRDVHLPQPDLTQRHPDMLTYAALYAVRLVLALACISEWVGHGELADGYVRVAGVAVDSGVTEARTDSAAGDSDDDGPDAA